MFISRTNYEESIGDSFAKGFEAGNKFEARDSKYDRDYLTHELALSMNHVHDLKHDINQSWVVMYYPANGNFRSECMSTDLSLTEAVKHMNKLNKDNPEAPGFFTIEVF